METSPAGYYMGGQRSFRHPLVDLAEHRYSTNVVASLFSSSASRFASVSANVTFFSIVSASATAGSVVAPYPKYPTRPRQRIPQTKHSRTAAAQRRTEPLPGRDAQVPVPFTPLQAVLGDEPALEPDELLVRPPHMPGCPEQLAPQGRAERDVTQLLEPTRDATAAVAWLFAEDVFERAFRVLFGVVERGAGGVDVLDRFAEV